MLSPLNKESISHQRCKPIYWKPELFNVGKWLHIAEEKYYENSYSASPSYEYIFYWMYEELRKVWGDATPEELLRAYNMVKNIAKFEFERVNKNPIKPHIELTNTNVAGYYLKVDGFDEQLVYPWDLKSSRKPSVGKSGNIQAIVYKFGLDALFGIDLEKFYFHFPCPDKIVEVDFKDKKMEPIFDEVKTAQKEIQKSFRTWKFEKNPRTPSMCNWCELKYYCKKLKL